jgi:hypothetical protein
MHACNQRRARGYGYIYIYTQAEPGAPTICALLANEVNVTGPTSRGLHRIRTYIYTRRGPRMHRSDLDRRWHERRNGTKVQAYAIVPTPLLASPLL